MQNKRKKSGQGMTEYIIIMAVVAIGAILIIGILGKNIKTAFAKAASAMSGRQERIKYVEPAAEDTEQNDMGTFDKRVAVDN